MNQTDKNEILKQVGSILQFCQVIVSRLSSSSPPSEVNNNFNNLDKEADEASVNEHYNDQIRELANTDKEAHEELIETIAKFRDEKQEHHDIVDCDNDLWWDCTYPPLQFYTLMYDDDLISLYDYDVDTSKECESMPSDVPEDELMQSPITEDVLMQSPITEDVLMHSVLQFLHDEVPNAIYDPNWREERRKKAINPEFYILWTNYDHIFTDVKDDQVFTLSPDAVQEIRYHSIDIANVNARFIGNIPKPSHIPVQGVSQDPDFYHKLYPRNDYYQVQKYLKFEEPSPFGVDYGYETDIGIVPPPTEPIHGYIWQGGSWRLHAVKPGEGRSIPRRRRG